MMALLQGADIGSLAVMCRMEALYKQLSGHFHMSFVPTDDIAIVEGILNREQMKALDCGGTHFTVKTELKYILEPATSWVGVCLAADAHAHADADADAL